MSKQYINHGNNKDTSCSLWHNIELIKLFQSKDDGLAGWWRLSE